MFKNGYSKEINNYSLLINKRILLFIDLLYIRYIPFIYIFEIKWLILKPCCIVWTKWLATVTKNCYLSNIPKVIFYLITILVALAKDQVASVPLSRCSLIARSCGVCVALQDPYCAWSIREGQCVSLENSNVESLDSATFLQVSQQGWTCSDFPTA